MSTMTMEFNTFPVAHPARPFSSSWSASFTSLATPGGSAKSTAAPHSLNSRRQENRTVYEGSIHDAPVTFDKRDATELKFSSQSHLVILVSDGISGGCEWSNGSQVGRLASVAPNTIIFNPARANLFIRKRTSRRRCLVWLLSIDPAFVNRLDVGDVNVAGLQFRQQIGIEDHGVRQAIVAIKQEVEAPDLNSRLYVDTLLMLLLTRLMRCASNFSRPQSPSYVKGGLTNWRLKRALELLEGTQAKTPSLAEIAGPLRLRPGSFCRAFKQSTGRSPHRYLLEHRVNRAKEMMRDQERTLTEIALDCGFGGSSHFSVVFKRITGITPQGYRSSL
jgi:AraC-like DNA-binding protein